MVNLTQADRRFHAEKQSFVEKFPIGGFIQFSDGLTESS